MLVAYQSLLKFHFLSNFASYIWSKQWLCVVLYYLSHYSEKNENNWFWRMRNRDR